MLVWWQLFAQRWTGCPPLRRHGPLHPEQARPPGDGEADFLGHWFRLGACLGGGLLSQLPAADEPNALKQLSLEELMQIEVTATTRNPVKLSEAASAVQVLRSEDILRSGYQTLPDVLRLAPNLQVAQVNSSQWAISARGFNNVLANKLLVMIDGRTVYTPLYGGVFWDVQNVMLEDVDRVEVTSGPGGTLWGANAVNGVINIISKDAEQTQGLYLSAGAGTSTRDAGAVRYGGAIGKDVFYRIYAQRFDRDSTVLLDGGGDANDDWHMTQGGGRLDWKPDNNLLTLQGDVYDGNPNPDGTNGVGVDTHGGNVLGRWTHTISESSDFQLQVYYDWTLRDFNNGFAEEVQTYDADWQHRFRIDRIHEVTWGMGCRLIDDHETNLPLFAFEPAHEQLNLYSAFLQDQIAIINGHLYLTLGTKVEHNDFTGFEYQPNARLAWMPDDRNTIWSSVSRAVRTPSRIDRDFRLLLNPTFPVFEENDSFHSERVIAYELGWRMQPLSDLSCSLSGFYNDYADLRSAEPGPPPFNLPITFSNGVYGETYGVEVAIEARLADWWRIRGGYTFLKKHLFVASSSQDANGASAESNDPESQALLQSLVDLPWNFQLDSVVRYVDDLPKPHVSDYVEVDVRLACHPNQHLELAVVGQNLVHSEHSEFKPPSPSSREIERSVFANVTVRW